MKHEESSIKAKKENKGGLICNEKKQNKTSSNKEEKKNDSHLAPPSPLPLVKAINKCPGIYKQKFISFNYCEDIFISLFPCKLELRRFPDIGLACYVKLARIVTNLPEQNIFKNISLQQKRHTILFASLLAALFEIQPNDLLFCRHSFIQLLWISC